jgi:hypothetical protein
LPPQPLIRHLAIVVQQRRLVFSAGVLCCETVGCRLERLEFSVRAEGWGYGVARSVNSDEGRGAETLRGRRRGGTCLDFRMCNFHNFEVLWRRSEVLLWCESSCKCARHYKNWRDRLICLAIANCNFHVLRC